MLFDEIPGQQSAKDSLKGMVREGRLPHAMLFLGPRGSGKLALALATARYLLCERRAEAGRACGEASGPHGADGTGFCANCRKTSRFIHPDLHFSMPTVGPRAISDTFLDAWREAIHENPWLDFFRAVATLTRSALEIVVGRDHSTTSECHL